MVFPLNLPRLCAVLVFTENVPNRWSRRRLIHKLRCQSSSRTGGNQQDRNPNQYHAQLVAADERASLRYLLVEVDRTPTSKTAGISPIWVLADQDLALREASAVSAISLQRHGARILLQIQIITMGPRVGLVLSLGKSHWSNYTTRLDSTSSTQTTRACSPTKHQLMTLRITPPSTSLAYRLIFCSRVCLSTHHKTARQSLKRKKLPRNSFEKDLLDLNPLYRLRLRRLSQTIGLQQHLDSLQRHSTLH